MTRSFRCSVEIVVKRLSLVLDDTLPSTLSEQHSRVFAMTTTDLCPIWCSPNHNAIRVYPLGLHITMVSSSASSPCWKMSVTSFTRTKNNYTDKVLRKHCMAVKKRRVTQSGFYKLYSKMNT